MRAARSFDNDDEGEEMPAKLRGRSDKLHFPKQAANTSGITTKCFACEEVERRGNLSRRLGYHRGTCKGSIFNEMAGYRHYTVLVNKHGNTKPNGDMDLITDEQQRQQTRWAKQAINMIEQKVKVERNNVGSSTNNAMMKIMLKEIDAAEVYNPRGPWKWQRRMIS